MRIIKKSNAAAFAIAFAICVIIAVILFGKAHSGGIQSVPAIPTSTSNPALSLTANALSGIESTTTVDQDLQSLDSNMSSLSDTRKAIDDSLKQAGN